MKNRLYIIGNGFDLHHGMMTSYSNFRDYVKKNYSGLYDVIEEYIPVDDGWSNFEDALAYMDPDQIVDNCLAFLPSYGADDWSDSGHHDFQYEVDKIVESLSVSLYEVFLSGLVV